MLQDYQSYLEVLVNSLNREGIGIDMPIPLDYESIFYLSNKLGVLLEINEYLLQVGEGSQVLGIRGGDTYKSLLTAKVYLEHQNRKIWEANLDSKASKTLENLEVAENIKLESSEIKLGSADGLYGSKSIETPNPTSSYFSSTSVTDSEENSSSLGEVESILDSSPDLDDLDLGGLADDLDNFLSSLSNVVSGIDSSEDVSSSSSSSGFDYDLEETEDEELEEVVEEGLVEVQETKPSSSGFDYELEEDEEEEEDYQASSTDIDPDAVDYGEDYDVAVDELISDLVSSLEDDPDAVDYGDDSDEEDLDPINYIPSEEDYDPDAVDYGEEYDPDAVDYGESEEEDYDPDAINYEESEEEYDPDAIDYEDSSDDYDPDAVDYEGTSDGYDPDAIDYEELVEEDYSGISELGGRVDDYSGFSHSDVRGSVSPPVKRTPKRLSPAEKSLKETKGFIDSFSSLESSIIERFKKRVNKK